MVSSILPKKTETHYPKFNRHANKQQTQVYKGFDPIVGCMRPLQSRCKCITAWLQTKEMAFIVHTTVGSCSEPILIVFRVRTGLLF
jgi:hypothetical protein